LLVCCEPWLVFVPASAAARWAPKPAREIEDITLTTADGTPLHAWWWPAPHAKEALLFLHGNGGNLTDCRDMLSRLRYTLDMPLLIVDYPGYGKSGGSPSEQGCYQAADAAYDWLRGRDIAARDILLFGDSLGGGVAVELASRRDCRALVLVKTFTRLPDVGSHLYPILPVRWLMRHHFDSLSRIGQCHRPVLIAHGTADTFVPFELGKRLYEAANEPKVFVTLEGGVHDGLLPDELLGRLKTFVQETRTVP
jgi:fermentation-respiration switch protein FrsA (DUF1100 family)